MNLNKIAEGLRLIADGLEDSGDKKAGKDRRPSVQKDTKPRKPAPKTEETEQAAEKPEPTSAPEAENTVTKEVVIQALQAVAKKHGRKRIDTILSDFNVDKVSALAADDYADVLIIAQDAVK